MTRDTVEVRIGPSDKAFSSLGFGGYTFGPEQWSGKEDHNLLAAMTQALEQGINHFDTASSYGNGHSEQLMGQFIHAQPGRREQIYLASKFETDEPTARAMLDAVDASRDRLQTDMIDLYYIHWPRSGKDMRPWMEGLETARQQGKIKAIGVSNFSVEQMEALAQVGKIDAHQIPYNLLWRFAEKEIIPYCVEQGIAVVTYSSIAHGILVGRYDREVQFPPGDQRIDIVLMRPFVWPRVYEAVEAFKVVAAQTGRSLVHLAIRWVIHQSHIDVALVGARNARQAVSNGQALAGDIEDSVFEELTAISDELVQHIPDTGNPYARRI